MMVSGKGKITMGKSSMKHKKTLHHCLKTKSEILPCLHVFPQKKKQTRRGGGGRTEVWQKRSRPKAHIHKVPPPPQQSYLSSKLQDVRTRLVEVNPWLSCSYPQSHKAWCTGDRAQRRGILGVYGIRREKFFSRINSHVIDVLKVDRRGDQAGVMMRGWMREAWLTKWQEEEQKS